MTKMTKIKDFVEKHIVKISMLLFCIFIDNIFCICNIC